MRRFDLLAPTVVLYQAKKTGATSDVAPAEENIPAFVIAQTTAAATFAGRRDSRLTSTKLTSATARL